MAPPTAAAVTVICDVPNAVGSATVTKVDPGSVAAADVAVTVTVAGLGTTAGDVYDACAWLAGLTTIVPFVLPPVTPQVTFWLVEAFTVAVNCCCVAAAGHELPASSANKVANPGFTVTVTGGGGVPLPATPPQESEAISPSPKQTTAIPL